jgi:hypothetical protein
MSEGFFSRWSKRKRGEAPADVVAEAAPQPSPMMTEAAPALPALHPDVAEPAAPPEPEFDLASLPDIENATAETDFTAFLQKGVPESLKRQALRRAWSLDPAIRDFCGPADYAWDFNAVDGVPGFSLSLGGDLTKLLAQAIGQLESWDDKQVSHPEAPSFLPPGATTAPLAPPDPENPPEAPLRMALATAEPVAEQPASAEEPKEQPLRRHGSARPA